jgi:hypothetical protein
VPAHSAPQARLAALPAQISASGPAGIAAGKDARYNATGKHASVADNRTFLTIINTIRADLAATELTAEQAEDELKSYAAQLNRHYGRLDLEILIPARQPTLPPIQLRDVFVPPRLRPDPPLRLELPVELMHRLVSDELPGPDEQALVKNAGLDPQQWNETRKSYRSAPALPLVEALGSDTARRCVLLGDPGAGKSTIARYLALELADAAAGHTLPGLEGLLPIIVELRRYAEANWRDQSFEEFLEDQHRLEFAPSPALVHHCLTSGQALVVFDGLDELFDNSAREIVTRRIAAFAEKYRDVRICVTSRVIGYRPHPLAPGFTHYFVEGLDSEQITAFASAWFQAVCGTSDDAGRLAERLVTAVEGSRPVRELAGNPLLLTILAIIARRQPLPRDRASVYEHAVNVLIAQWDQESKHLAPCPEIQDAGLDMTDRVEMLQRLARHMQSGQDGIIGNNIPAKKIIEVFTVYLRDEAQLEAGPARKTAKAIVAQLRKRNFILSHYGGEVYGFVHRAFLEYLAAAEIVTRYQHHDLDNDALLKECVDQRVADASWHEVLLLIVSMAGDRFAASAIDRILTHEDDSPRAPGTPPAVLALRALAELRRVSRLAEQSDAVLTALVPHLEPPAALSAGTESDLCAALRTLGPAWSGRARLLRWLHTAQDTATSAVFHLYTEPAALRAIATTAVTTSLRAGALTRLATLLPHDSTVAVLLTDRATHDDSPHVRVSALRLLADRAGQHAVIRICCTDRATDPHEHEAVRQAALTVLAQAWPDDVSRNLLLSEAQCSPSQGMRIFALQTLAARWRVDRRVHELIAEFAHPDHPAQLQSEAVACLVLSAPDEESERERLTAAVHQETNPAVRGTMAFALALRWQHDEARDILQELLEDTNPLVRSSALVGLTSFYWEDDAIHDLLLGILQNGSPQDQFTLAMSIQAFRPDDSDARHKLMSFATQSSHPHLASTLTTALATGAPQDPALRDWLVQQAARVTDPALYSATLYALAKNWNTTPAVIDLLQTLETCDHEPQPGTARELLDLYGPASPAGQARALRTRTLHDDSHQMRLNLLDTLHKADHPAVRVTAANLLAACWPHHPDTQSALKQQPSREDQPDIRTAMTRALTMAQAYAPLHRQLL